MMRGFGNGFRMLTGGNKSSVGKRRSRRSPASRRSPRRPRSPSSPPGRRSGRSGVMRSNRSFRAKKRRNTFVGAPRQSGYIPKSRGGTRKLNEYFRTMLKAKRAGAPSFQYKGKTYYRGTKINRKNGVEFVFYSKKQKGKSRSRSRSPSR